LGNSKIVKQLVENENLLMVGMVLAILGYYVIAEWQVLGDLFIVFSGYGVMFMPTKLARTVCYFLILRLRIVKKRSSDV